MVFRSSNMVDRFREHQQSLSLQPRREYACRVLKLLCLHLLSYRPAFLCLTWLFTMARCDADLFLSNSVKGFQNKTTAGSHTPPTVWPIDSDDSQATSSDLQRRVEEAPGSISISHSGVARLDHSSGDRQSKSQLLGVSNHRQSSGRGGPKTACCRI